MSRRREGRSALQRLFSTFPGGPPGIGLLLLRLMIGLAATMQGASYLSNIGGEKAGAWVAAAMLTVSGVCLLVGFLTPAMSVLAGAASLAIALSWFPIPPSNIFNAKVAAAQMVVSTVAVAFLGPGAFSLDAHLFGRREIRIPKNPASAKR